MIIPRIGELKDVISIINVTKPFNVRGEGTLSSTYVSNIMAKVEPLGGGVKEIAETQEQQAFSQTYHVWVRYLADVTVFQQITWGTKRLYQTAPPEEMANGRWLLIHAEECQKRDV